MATTKRNLSIMRKLSDVNAELYWDTAASFYPVVIRSLYSVISIQIIFTYLQLSEWQFLTIYGGCSLEPYVALIHYVHPRTRLSHLEPSGKTTWEKTLRKGRKVGVQTSPEPEANSRPSKATCSALALPLERPRHMSHVSSLDVRVTNLYQALQYIPQPL